MPFLKKRLAWLCVLVSIWIAETRFKTTACWHWKRAIHMEDVDRALSNLFGAPMDLGFFNEEDAHNT